jgi:two-component system, NtrC family, nitrogen regulation response regulator GlnG
MKNNILLADDDASIRFVLSKYLTRAGYGVKATDNPQTLLKWVKAGEGDIILTDVHMGTDEIFSYVPQLKSLRPDLPIIIISANTRMVTALKSRQSGVFEYIPKPFELPDLENIIGRALETQTKQQPHTHTKSDRMIGRSKVMQPVFRAISDYASGNVPIFIWGAAGTGKNLAAQCVHDAGARRELDFFAFDKFGESRSLLETIGGGDIFVDRVHELSLAQQAHLLESLEHNESRTQENRLRVIATSEMSLETIQKKQIVRADLLSHLMGGKIYLPPLSARADDLVDLAVHFLETVRPRIRGNIDAPALALLKGHLWPGNVRELRNLMHVIALRFPDADITEDIVNRMLSSQSIVTTRDVLSNDVKLACMNLLRAALDTEQEYGSPYEQALEWIEKPLIAEALRLTDGNNSKAADLLGIHRNTLRTKLRKWQGG